MKYAMSVTKEDAYGKGSLPISNKSALYVCRALNKKKFNDAKKLLEDLVSEKRSLKGKYYTKTAKEILNLLKTVESNANVKKMDLDKSIVFISAHKGPTLLRGRRKRKFGMKLKMSNIQIVIRGAKNGTGKEVRKGSN